MIFRSARDEEFQRHQLFLAHQRRDLNFVHGEADDPAITS